MLDGLLDDLRHFHDPGHPNPDTGDIMIEPDGPYMPEEPIVPEIPDMPQDSIPANDFIDDIVRPQEIGASNPYASGFDDEHPIPTYKELRNAGFTDFEANQIIYGTYTSFSEKELFECLYGSDNPKEAYDAMMQEKAAELSSKIDRLITEL